MELSTLELRTVDLALLDSLEVQPEGRDSKIDDLRNSIEVSCFIAPPILMPKKASPRYVILDGHRRIAVAKELGITKLQCLIAVDISASQRSVMFFVANSVTKMVDGNQRAEAWAKASPKDRPLMLEALPLRQRKQIEVLVEMFGEEKVIELALNKKATASLAQSVRTVIRWCNNRGYKTPTETQIGEWITANKALRLINTVGRRATYKDTYAIVQAINSGRPYKGMRQ